ncbi:MAG: response regulator transcription factor [Deltaproteobacteria bacterium]|nr:response regulator transcription factor [Deltaproteobacteria bacterium]
MENDLTGHTMYIIGPNLFSYEALSGTVEKETGVQCRCLKGFGEVDNDRNKKGDSSSELYLWDCLGKNLDVVMSAFSGPAETLAQSDYLVLFNVTPGLGIEESAMNHGIRGVFYQDDNLSMFIKGIKAVYNGELWYSREVMTKYILDDRDEGSVSVKVRQLLTHREIEILSLVAVGCKNEEVADKLCVSPHTIKTHLYNIYKKINVTNRLQATLWAAKNL